MYVCAIGSLFLVTAKSYGWSSRQLWQMPILQIMWTTLSVAYSSFFFCFPLFFFPTVYKQKKKNHSREKSSWEEDSREVQERRENMEARGGRVFLISRVCQASGDWSEHPTETAIARWPFRTSQEILNARVWITSKNPHSLVLDRRLPCCAIQWLHLSCPPKYSNWSELIALSRDEFPGGWVDLCISQLCITITKYSA